MGAEWPQVPPAPPLRSHGGAHSNSLLSPMGGLYPGPLKTFALICNQSFQGMWSQVGMVVGGPGGEEGGLRQKAGLGVRSVLERGRGGVGVVQGGAEGPQKSRGEAWG